MKKEWHTATKPLKKKKKKKKESWQVVQVLDSKLRWLRCSLDFRELLPMLERWHRCLAHGEGGILENGLTFRSSATRG
jgi:hypothetical protein